LKQAGGEISIPIPRANKSLKYDIKHKIAIGKYNLGVPVLQTSTTKFVLAPGGGIEKKESIMTARKYPLKDIRKNSLKKNAKYSRLRSDEEYQNMTDDQVSTRLLELHENTSTEASVTTLRQIETTRHWMIWHDHSGIGNNGLMLFLLRVLYDPAIHYTNQEYQEKYGTFVDVQSVIEEPHLYMMGMSGSSDADQMKFVPTRRECLKSLSKTIEVNDIEFKDKMRLMNGDNPSIEFEDGTQKGGHRGCSGCDGDIRRAGEYDYMAIELTGHSKKRNN